MTKLAASLLVVTLAAVPTTGCATIGTSLTSMGTRPDESGCQPTPLIVAAAVYTLAGVAMASNGVSTYDGIAYGALGLDLLVATTAVIDGCTDDTPGKSLAD